MSGKYTLFYRKKLLSIDFSAPEISFDGLLILLKKIEREYKLIKKFGKHLPDLRNPRFITYTREAQFKQQ
ncbi:MAG: transposase [Flavobacteriaceae bacterium]|nr:transposase [Flavobacteriaceae bacterium]